MATVSAVPFVIDALLEQAAAGVAAAGLTAVSVVDGIPFTYGRGDFLMIGVEDPDLVTAQQTATAQQAAQHAGGATRQETGEIVCAALVWTGDSANGALKVVRHRAYQIADAFAGQLRIDKNLGLDGTDATKPTVYETSFGTQLALSQGQDSKGAYALVVFRVGFLAWLTL